MVLIFDPVTDFDV